ncbi:MAG: hypothetical protein ACREXV_11880 [Polaromonas sp.]
MDQFPLLTLLVTLELLLFTGPALQLLLGTVLLLLLLLLQHLLLACLLLLFLRLLAQRALAQCLFALPALLFLLVDQFPLLTLLVPLELLLRPLGLLGLKGRVALCRGPRIRVHHGCAAGVFLGLLAQCALAQRLFALPALLIVL